MRWSDYYEKINDWAVSTAVNKISPLEDMGAPDEIVDTLNIMTFEDEKRRLGSEIVTNYWETIVMCVWFCGIHCILDSFNHSLI